MKQHHHDGSYLIQIKVREACCTPVTCGDFSNASRIIIIIIGEVRKCQCARLMSQISGPRVYNPNSTREGYFESMPISLPALFLVNESMHDQLFCRCYQRILPRPWLPRYQSLCLLIQHTSLLAQLERNASDLRAKKTDESEQKIRQLSCRRSLHRLGHPVLQS